MLSDASGITVGGCTLERQIGHGGAGTVYRAIQLGVNRPVAVKLIPAEVDGLGGTARFEREAQAAGALDHPHCLPVYAAGEQDGLLYLVMRLVNGSDLAEIVRRHGPLPLERAVTLMEQVASAIDYAHRQGMVHRDLKPANILIEPDGGPGHAFVSDFGLMRSLADPDPITLAGQWVGTPQFAAPEQRRGETVGPPADIYALGRVLAHTVGPRPPAALAAVIDHALAEHPADRFGTAGELAAAARRAIAPSGAETVEAAVVRRRSLWGPVLVVLITLVLALAAVVIALSRHHGSERAGAGAGAPGAGHGGTQTRTGTSTGVNSTGSSASSGSSGSSGAGTALVTATFTATLPSGWVVLSQNQAMTGFHRTVAQNASGSITTDIDRGGDAPGSLAEHADGVRAATAQQTDGYLQRRFASIRLAGASAVIWAFSVAGQPDGQHVDVFRQVGDQYFAVLSSSNAQATSQSTSLAIAAGIRSR